MPRYETYLKVKEVYNISSETVRNWAKRGQIRYKCVQNATRKTWLYDLDSIGEYLQQDSNTQIQSQKASTHHARVLYLRVSSAERSTDLTRQRKLLQSAFPDATVIEDIGSGLNFERQGFASLVQQICRDQVAQVVVTYRDRIARFGYELFELLCKEHGCSIMVYNEGMEHEPEEELKDDLLTMVNFFSASHHGRRGVIARHERKEKEATHQGKVESSNLCQAQPDPRPEPNDVSE